MKIIMEPKILQMLDGISHSSITLELGDLEFFRQTIVNYSSGEECTGAKQESIHHGRPSFFLHFHLPGHANILLFQIDNLFA
jgi:hypothetical protein